MAKPRALREFGYRLRTLREAAGYSQEVLAEYAEVHINYVGRLERGLANPSLLVLRALARALGITAAELIRPLG
jgi:transcriptional regulator with XRE-family HTH domain